MPETEARPVAASLFGLVSNRIAIMAMLFSFLLPARAALPPGWSDADLGSPALAGSAGATNGTWVISASGTDICNSDQLHFAWMSAVGDGVLSARVESLQGPSGAQAGLMIRNDNSPGSIETAVLATTNGITFQWRSTPGSGCSYQIALGTAPNVLPVTLRLVRAGTSFSAYWTTNGVDFYQVGSTQTVPINSAAPAGLAVSANNNTTLCTATLSQVTMPAPLFGVYRELWPALSSAAGDTLDALTNSTLNPGWPNNPDPNYTFIFSDFETPTNTGMTYYGQRLRTFVVPPATGAYTLWIASDNTSQLLFSPGEAAANAVPVAWVSTATAPRGWTVEPNQRSAPVSLQAGVRYYLEARMQQSSGNDNLAVRWQLPNGAYEEPLTSYSAGGTRMVPCAGVDAPPGIYLQPTNTIAADGGTAAFVLLVTNQAPVAYQWYINGSGPVANATNPVCLITGANPNLNNGQVYYCVVSNSAGVSTSFLATLSVPADVTPPTVARALCLNGTNVQLVFSEPLDAVSATNLGNYVFTNGLAIRAAALGPDNVTVTLTTDPMLPDSNYLLVLNNLKDRATTPNLIAANTAVFLFNGPYTPLAIGNASPVGLISGAPGGYNVSGSGKDIGSASDQFQFAYQTRAGDFDVRVRLNALTQSDAFAKAGLMVREDVSAGSRFAGVFATPAMNGTFFGWRDPAGSVSRSAGNLPVNYPYTWLRLKRSGNTFTGYAGYDGNTWSLLGSAGITFSNQVFFGFAVSSHVQGQLATAQFRDLGDATNAALGLMSLPREALGPCSRKTPIVISEIMYKPAARADGNDLEYVEIYNSNPWFHDIGGYQLVSGNMNFTFPRGTIINGGAFLVVAASPAAMQSVYGIANVIGPYTGSLKKADTLQLLDEQGAVLLTVPYSNVHPWPVPTDGTGHSLVLARPTYGEEDPRAWDISDVVGGSPGAMDGYRPDPLRNVVINEFLAHTDPPEYDYIELYNHANQPVDISGCILTDDFKTNKFVVPQGTVIPARGFVWYSETNMNFRLDALGETIYFKNPDASRYLDAVQFGGQENGVPTGRWPDGADDWYRLNATTPGTNNAAILQSAVVINELMYKPISGDDDDQYVELYNRSGQTVNLGGWELSGGISFTFSANTLLGPDKYLVVARNAAQLRPKYPNLTTGNCLGDYGGKLSHNGEYLALTMPDTTVQTNSQGVVTTNLLHIVMNDVTWGTGGRWGLWSAGGGSSLELIDPNANNRLAANWADSDESQKSAWTNIEWTGVLDNGRNVDPTIDYAQIGLLDVGECLVDNVEVHAGAGVNLVANPDFEAGTNGWTFQGDHSRSFQENSGYLSAHSLHIRAGDRMWTGDNSCQVALSSNSMAAGQTATLRFKARWLCGWPEVLLRLNGNWLEATGPLPLPSNLGTPGGRNSRFVSNAGPAIYGVSHSPSLPAANQTVLVTACVHDPVSVTNLAVFYRVDPATTYTAVPMTDDGTGGDVIARDGVFTASLPGRAAGTIVAFYIGATDGRGASTRLPTLLNDGAPGRECVIRFGDTDPAGSFGVYHLWITQAQANRWSQLGDLSNESHDCTFVNGSRVIYDAQGRFAGSPYHQSFNTPNGNLCHYKWTFPDDDKFLGATAFHKLHQPGNGAGDDASLQREQLANTLLRALGVPWLNRRYVAVYVNGSRRGTLMEDTQMPDADVVKEHYPDDNDGWLYKMQPWFEFAPFSTGGTVNNFSWCNLVPYTTTGGVKKTARYRYMFLSRRAPNSANDYTNVFSLVDAASSHGTANYVANMENMADMENWMRVFAANHAAGNWDSFGCQNSQNLYGYLGAKGTRYSLHMFDFNIVFGNSGSWGPGANLFAVNGQDPNTQSIYSEPTFRRMYWRALQELVNGPLNVANSGPLLDAKYNAFVANGLSVESPSTAIKSWLSSARSSIASQLAAENTSSFTVNPSVTVNNNLALVTGLAPVNIEKVLVNGMAYPLTWTSVTGYRVSVPLVAGLNGLSVVGVDRYGQPVPSASNYVAVTYSGVLPSPVGQVVFNEIMPSATVAGAEYIELLNVSGTAAFDLSGWQIPELGYTFPSGSLISPGAFLVLAANRPAYAAAYGAVTPLFDTFPGKLSANGSLLSLLAPDSANPGALSVITRVRYSTGAPWPVVSAQAGTSLQLIDSHQDNWRAGNWGTSRTNNAGPPPPAWQYVTLTGTAPRPVLLICMHNSPGDVYIDDLKLVAGSVAEAGDNLLTNGDFETSLTGPWTVSDNMTNSSISTAVKHSGNASLHLVATSAGDTIPLSIWENTAPIITNATYTLSYWYLPSTNGSQLLIRLSGSSPNANQIYSLVNIQPPPYVAQASCTPGAPNSISASLPAFPPLWLNELQADNLTGITNSAGTRTAWFELFNPSSNPVALSGLQLAGQYTNLSSWAFPAGAVINPGEFKVIFADGQTGLSTTNQLHTSFTLPGGAGSLALSRLYEGQPQVLDFVDYTNLPPDYAYGSMPDGQSFFRQAFAFPTPGATNDTAIHASLIPYFAVGSVYVQDFDSLPNPGAVSVNTANPVTINGTTYSLANPLDFAFPASAATPGGLGLSSVAGWYGSAALLERFGATSGDQTTGGQLSFGLPGSANRALGLLATSSTGGTAFGARFVNQTPKTLRYLSVQATGEVWRQSNLPKTLQCYYFIDPTRAISFPNAVTGYLPELNVSIPTVATAVGGVAVDGTSPANQTALAVTDESIADWPPGAALWLVWQMTDDTGKAQGLAIDNFRFAASDQSATSTISLTVQTSDGNLVLSWPTQAGQSYQIEYSDDLATGVWTPLNGTIVGTGAPFSVTNSFSLSNQRFFRLNVLP